MVDEKTWYQSRTIWGALIAVAASILNGFGLPIDDVNQAALAEAMVQMVGAMGAIFAIYGRLAATKVVL